MNLLLQVTKLFFIIKLQLMFLNIHSCATNGLRSLRSISVFVKREITTLFNYKVNIY